MWFGLRRYQTGKQPKVNYRKLIDKFCQKLAESISKEIPVVFKFFLYEPAVNKF